MTNGAGRSNTARALGNMPSAANGSTGNEPEQPKQDKGPRPPSLRRPLVGTDVALDNSSWHVLDEALCI
jgi:hypothetical protein